ncbi:MAG: GGDEF domain-containing protein [Cypionkella sp.]
MLGRFTQRRPTVSAVLSHSLAATLSQTWEMGRTGRSTEALAQARGLLEQARAQEDTARTAECLTQIAWFCLQLGHADQGIDCVIAAKDLWKQLGDIAGQARSGAIYAWLLIELGLVDEGLAEASTAFDLAELCDDDTGLAFAINAKAVALMFCGQNQLSGPLFDRALALAGASGDRWGQGLYLVNLGFLQVSLAEAAELDGRVAEGQRWRHAAIVTNNKGIDVAQACGDKWTLRTALCNGAEYYGLLDQPTAADACLERWLAISGDVGLREHIHYLYTSGELLMRAGRLTEALDICTRAVELAEASSTADDKASTLRRLSEVHEALGHDDEALRLYKLFHLAYQRQMGEMVRRRAQLLEMQHETRKLRAQAVMLEEQAGHDPLTGLSNRRALDAEFRQLQGSRFCLAIADLDHFKAINDQYSHVVGDAVLQRVATVLSGLGAEMHTFRLGGEEFALLFPGLDITAAAAVAEAVRSELERTDWSDLGSRLRVTASIGVAVSKGGPLTELMTMADRRLYRAKAAGRNCVVSTDLVEDASRKVA